MSNLKCRPCEFGGQCKVSIGLDKARVFLPKGLKLTHNNCQYLCYKTRPEYTFPLKSTNLIIVIICIIKPDQNTLSIVFAVTWENNFRAISHLTFRTKEFTSLLSYLIIR